MCDTPATPPHPGTHTATAESSSGDVSCVASLSFSLARCGHAGLGDADDSEDLIGGEAAQMSVEDRGEDLISGEATRISSEPNDDSGTGVMQRWGRGVGW